MFVSARRLSSHLLRDNQSKRRETTVNVTVEASPRARSRGQGAKAPSVENNQMKKMIHHPTSNLRQPRNFLHARLGILCKFIAIKAI